MDMEVQFSELRQKSSLNIDPSLLFGIRDYDKHYHDDFNSQLERAYHIDLEILPTSKCHDFGSSGS